MRKPVLADCGQSFLCTLIFLSNASVFLLKASALANDQFSKRYNIVLEYDISAEGDHRICNGLAIA
jgi:hypothetical protein